MCLQTARQALPELFAGLVAEDDGMMVFTDDVTSKVSKLWVVSNSPKHILLHNQLGAATWTAIARLDGSVFK